MSMVPFEFEGLTVEWAEKAHKDLGETPEVKAKTLREFKKLISEHKDLLCRPDDIFQLRFIRLKKYDVDKAVKLCRSYYTFKSKHQGVYNGLKPSDLRRIMEMDVLSYAPYRLPGGPHIAVLRLGNFNWHEATVQDLIAAILLMGEMALDFEATQLFGSCLIVDLRGFTLFHYLQFMTISTISFVVSVIQDCWPAKIQSIHLVNEPVFYRAILNLLRPILKKKTKERLHFHGSNLSSLHKTVPRQYLPEELGGTLGPINYKGFLNFFLDKEPYIKMLDSYGMVKENQS